MKLTSYSSSIMLLCFAASSIAQPLVIGVKGGVPLTDAFETAKGNQSAYLTNTKRYTVGPTVELHLPARFSMEIDALYTRLGFDNRILLPSASYQVTRANDWQFPVLGKFEIAPGPVRPFVDLGVNIRHVSGIKQFRQVVSAATLQSVEVNSAAEFNKGTDLGITAGFGIAFKAGPVRMSPEFRYTYWGGEAFRDPAASLLHTNRNQGTFLLGFTF
jgi:Outer membrane protein beta-barrel domain